MTEELRWYLISFSHSRSIFSMFGCSLDLFHLYLQKIVGNINCLTSYQAIEMQTIIQLFIWPRLPLKLSETILVQNFLGQALKDKRLEIFDRQQITSSYAWSIFSSKPSRTPSPCPQALGDRARSKSRYDRALPTFLAMQTFQKQSQDKLLIVCRSTYLPRAVHHLIA